MNKNILLFSILLLLFLSSCSPNKQLARIDSKHGALPIMSFLANKHPELFDSSIVNVHDSIRFIDSIPVKLSINSSASFDRLVKNGSETIKNDSVDIKLTVKNGIINVSGTAKTKALVNKVIPYNKAVNCPKCPNIDEVRKLIQSSNQSKIISRFAAFSWGLIAGLVCLLLVLLLFVYLSKKI